MTSWAQVSYFIFIVKVDHYPTLSLAYLHLRVLDSFKFYFHILLMDYALNCPLAYWLILIVDMWYGLKLCKIEEKDIGLCPSPIPYTPID